MSYCVNCGVELGKDLKRCPLCGTLVINPNEVEREPELPFFPQRQERIKPVSKRELALLLSVMFASVAICCGLLNLALRPEIRWWLYAAGASAMLWIWFVPPLLWRGMSNLAKLAIDIGAVALYVLLIAVASSGMDWYLGLALPLIAAVAVITLIICYLMRGGRRSVLMSIVICLVGTGLMSMATEFILDFYFSTHWNPGWSLIVLAVCLGFSIPIIIVRLVPSLREEARRRFHL